MVSLNQKAMDGLAMFAAGYLKRWLETNAYDRLFSTETGEKLKNLDTTVRYGIEFALNALTAFFDARLAEDSTLKKLVKEIGIDIGPEISKRLVNGAREELFKRADTLAEKSVVQSLLGLDDEALKALLGWLGSKDSIDRDNIIRHFSKLSEDELVRLAKLSSDARDRLAEIMMGGSARPAEKASTGTLRSINDSLEQWIVERRRGQQQ